MNLLNKLLEMSLPTSLDDPAEVAEARRLHEAGHLLAKFLPLSKSRGEYGAERGAVVTEVTASGRAVAGRI